MAKKTITDRWSVYKRTSLQGISDLLGIASQTLIEKESTSEKITLEEISN